MRENVLQKAAYVIFIKKHNILHNIVTQDGVLFKDNFMFNISFMVS